MLDPDISEAQQALIDENQGLARYLARQFVRPGVEREDLEQVALLGLVAAAIRFDPDRGIPFGGFAVPTIKGELKRHLRDQRWVVRVPRRLQELALEVQSGTSRLSASLGRRPLPEEVAGEIQLPVADVIEGSAALASLSSDPLPDHSTPWMAIDDDGSLERIEGRVSVQEHLHSLDQRERRILSMYYFDGLSQREIGEQLGISQVRVSKLMARAVDRVRESAGV